MPTELPTVGAEMLFNEIRAFRAVIRTGSMTRAAATLHMSQPNISRLVSRLENKTGLALFTRLPGKLVPTLEAHVLFQDVERLFVGLEGLELSVENIRKFGNGRLRIASVPSLSYSLLPKTIARFNALTPDVPISVHTDSTSMVMQWVGSRFCDFGLVSYLDDAAILTQPTDVMVERTFNLEAACILPADHPLRHKTVIRAEMLTGMSFVSMASSDPLRAKVDQAFQPNDKRRLLYDTPHAVTICRMVGLGLGVSIVNPLVAIAADHTGLCIRRFEPSIVFASHVVAPRHRPESRLVTRFLGVMDEVLAEDLAAVNAVMATA
ncbi:LysR substrate-binding domain-containing protein [Limnohabitans sp. MMS-10A-178]|uniref:LysR substrate-binding domain-containing protein n=1 Tax=Limnohabitans sp. MMS-10A-178 TaxID=1835767 RepID=UPI000D390CFB|nr:LysR substrate-binding domain-containing protein [Limnohabitans sp. MMS-10A-178]PUE14701.1 hypothetical protein B9Z32_09440 [Limnohabitans sp. MMS-10A-178]